MIICALVVVIVLWLRLRFSIGCVFDKMFVSLVVGWFVVLLWIACCWCGLWVLWLVVDMLLWLLIWFAFWCCSLLVGC